MQRLLILLAALLLQDVSAAQEAVDMTEALVLPATGKLVSGDIEAQTRAVLANLKAVLEAGGTSFSNVVRTTIYLTDLANFPRVNAVYGEHFSNEPHPARATVQVVALPLGAEIEIDAIAAVPGEAPEPPARS